MPTDVHPDWPVGDGEMAARIRAFDWSEHVLGRWRAVRSRGDHRRRGPLLDDLRAGRTVRHDVGDAPSRPDLVALSQIGIRSLVSVPLMKAGRFVVNLYVHDAKLRVWTDDEIGLISEVAERTWGCGRAGAVGAGAPNYGALKVTGAQLHISWIVHADCGGAPRLRLTWTEQGVPAVPLKPARRGFGSELTLEAMPYRLRAETGLEFRGGGVRCAITLPLV